MNKTRFLLLRAFALCLAALPAQAQVVDVSEGPSTRLDRDERESAAPLDQPPFAHLYVNLMPGQPTAIADPESGPAAHQYAAYDVVVSVASKALYSDTRDSRRRDLAALNDLRRMSVHVRFEGLAADKATVLETSRHDPSVLALHMSPSNVTYGQAAQEGAGETTVKRVITGASHFLGPLGGLVNTFIGARHHPAGPSFFSYQSEDNEFGWNWYLSPNQTIEGIHKGSVLMQKRADVAFVRVTIDLVTDWEHHGLWTKPYTFLVAIPAGEPASAMNVKTLAVAFAATTVAMVPVSSAPRSPGQTGVAPPFVSGPNSNQVMSPLTTLAQVKTRLDRQPPAAAQAVVLDMLGLDSGIDLTTFDYIAVGNDPGASAAARMQARKARAMAEVLASIFSANQDTINVTSTSRNSAARNALAVYDLFTAGADGIPALKSIGRAVSAAIDGGLTPDVRGLVASHTIAADEVNAALEAVERKLASGGVPAPRQ